MTVSIGLLTTRAGRLAEADRYLEKVTNMHVGPASKGRSHKVCDVVVCAIRAIEDTQGHTSVTY